MRSLLPLLLLAGLLAGCQSAGPVARTWWKPWTWRGDKSVEERKTADAKAKAEAALDANSAATVRAAASKVAATGAALNARTNREPATDLAATFNGQAGALLPAVPIAELADVKTIVSGLLSTNAQLRADAEKRLDANDKKLAELQRMTGELRAKLDAAEQSHEQAVSKLTDAYAQERGVADKWRQEQAKSWGQKIFDLLGTGGLIALASTGVLSVPLAGRAFGFFSRVMPSTSALTGVVSAKGFDNVVAGVESVRDTLKNHVGDHELARRVDDLLRIERSPDDKKLISARRAKLKRKAAVESA